MKDYTYLALMDIYGDALTEKQRDMLADYYERDYSLSEIADNFGVSRQAVHSAVKQSEESLSEFESKFKIRFFVSEIVKRLQDIKRDCNGCADAAKKVAELEEFIRSVYGTVR